jgi:uncharacterized protein YndB with AHSA1/START domain
VTTQYALTTEWQLGAPIDRVFDALAAAETWPAWWRYVESVVLLRAGDANGLGAVRRYTWTSRLPYRLTFEMETTAIERPRAIAGIARGELTGTGRWTLRATSTGTVVVYEWNVGTGKRWMNALAPLLAPVFAWNHDQVMAEGGRGIARHLGVPLQAYAGTSARDRTGRRTT